MNAKLNILVTGSEGQLGKELQLIAPAFPQYDFIFLAREQLPVQQPDAVNTNFQQYRPHYLINCAAYTAVDKAEEDKELAILTNATAPGILAAACKENNCQLIHISTDYVFDGSANVPYTENAVTNPQGVYGASKLEGEKLVMKNDPASIIIRTSWLYSAFGNNFVKTMLKLMSEREEISVVNDQVGSPTYAVDLADAILQIITKLPTRHLAPATHTGIYNFSNAGIISWYNFAVAIKELANSKCKINAILTSAYPTKAKRPAYSVLDKEKIQTTFGIQLKDWRESLKDCVERLK